MSRRAKLLTAILVILITLSVVGCSANNSSSVKLDSGAIDQEYSGKIKPGLPREYKMTEKEKQDGFEKVQIYSKTKVPVVPQEPTPSGDNSDNDSGGGHGAKPQV